jgi:VanZ family protein
LNRFSRNLRYWIPALLWLAVIAVESLWLSSRVTSGWLWYMVFDVLHLQISPITFDRLHHLLRKGGHVAGYGLLCVLLFNSWYHSLSTPPAKRLRLGCAGLALGMTLVTAMLDEWHQSFDPARTGSIRDVGLDVTGGIIFLAIALFVFRLWRTATTEQLGRVSA